MTLKFNTLYQNIFFEKFKKKLAYRGNDACS